MNRSTRLRRTLRGARLALLWERLWRLAWPIPALAALFVAVAGFDVLPALAPWLHAIILAAFAAAFGWALWRLRALRPPSRDDARRRIEDDSGFSHRPLAALADRMAGDPRDKLAAALWVEQRRRNAALLDRLRLGLPHPRLARIDPYALRFAPVLLLAVALAGSWQDLPARLARAVDPELQLGGPPPLLQVWITPPEYTHVAPTMLQGQGPDGTLSVPTGSKLMAELEGGRDAELRLGDHATPFQRLDADSQRIETTLTQGGTLAIHAGWSNLAKWSLNVIPDRPPTIAFAAPPAADAGGRLRLEVTAEDDYGVARTWVTIRRADTPPGRPIEKPLEVALPLANGHPPKLHQVAIDDLTENPWAGLPVLITPEAADDAGQTGEGPAVRIIMPERPFHNPLARAVVALRKQLVADPLGATPLVEAGLAAILEAPEAFGNDMTVFLALSDARSRLVFGDLDEALPSVLDTMWQAALRIEDGDRPSAERELDRARAALDNALANHSPQSEIDRLTQELRAAIDRYLQALVDEAARNPQDMVQPGPNDRVITGQQLDDMISRLEEMARTGSPEAARQALAQLQQLLDQLRNAHPMQAGPNQQRGQQTMNALNNIMRDQRNLLDQTFRNSRDDARQGQPDGDARSQQEAIRKALGDAMQQLGDMGVPLPDQLGQAEQAMRGASKALGDGDMAGAVDAQTKALSLLQQGLQAAQQGIASQQMGNGTGVVGSTVPGQAPDSDPLGRPLVNSGTGDDGTVRIPTQSDTQKAREILDDLRKRAGDPDRSPAELDYLNRLLREFQ